MQQQPEALRWDFDPATTLVRLVVDNAKAVPRAIAMREKDRGIWQEITWAQMADTVLAVAAGLQQMGLERGKGVLVVGDNRPRLYMGMLCAGVLGAYAMPVYPDATPDEVARETRVVLEAMRGRAGHIFNLGHGLTPAAKLENIQSLVDTVRSYR